MNKVNASPPLIISQCYRKAKRNGGKMDIISAVGYNISLDEPF